MGPDPIDTDETLMRRFQAGDEESFEPIFNRYSEHVLNFAYRFLHSQAEAEDVTQEIFLRIYRGKDRYEAERPFRPWLFTIASRLLSNRVRDSKRRAQVSLDSTDSEYGEWSLNLPDLSTPQPQEVAAVKEKRRVIQAALDQLPEDQRIAVLLCRFEGLSYEEIAESMNTSISAVKSLLYRAHQNLKQLLSSLLLLREER